MREDEIDEEYFSRFEEELTDKQKYILKGLLSYQLFKLSKANEEFINSLKATWMFNKLYNILNKLKRLLIMNKSKMSEQFKLFLQLQKIDSSKYEYISKDCYDYKVRNLVTGVVGYIRY